MSLLSLFPESATAQQCGHAVAKYLTRLDVAKSEVAKVDYVLRQDDLRTGAASGSEAWVKLRSCRGGLVLVTDRTCRIRRSYGHGACRAILKK